MADRPLAAHFGHHFLIGLQPTTSLSDHDRRVLSQLRPAGVALFGENFAWGEPYDVWLDRYRELIAEVRGCIGRDRILVGIDHEGGRVTRPPPPVTHFAYARRWAGRAGAVAGAMAAELRSLGVNLSFAPVLDVDSNPDNPVIGERAFASSPDEVSRAGTEFIRALEAGGVLACPKHFPGHGDTDVDSHLALPVVNGTRDQLFGRELRPFQASIAAGVKAIMTAHILIPSIDARNPATISGAVVDHLLRGELGYRGAVITDDVGMGAVSELFRAPDSAARAIRAGSDLILVCSTRVDTELALDLSEGIARAAAEGTLPDHVAQTSADRIADLLRAAPQHEVARLEAAEFTRHGSLAPLRSGGEGQDPTQAGALPRESPDPG